MRFSSIAISIAIGTLCSGFRTVPINTRVSTSFTELPIRSRVQPLQQPIVTRKNDVTTLKNTIAADNAEGNNNKNPIFDAFVKVSSIATTLFPLWTVLFSGIALKNPNAFSWFTTEYFTAALAALMLSMGITLTPADFAKVLSRPNSTIMQFSLCYGVMPILAYALAKAFGLDSAMLAGMVLVGSINGGQASNLCTYIAKGNVALSVSMQCVL